MEGLQTASGCDGYKFPVMVVVTMANVHDSQVAIPMERITETRLSWRCSLMDAAYDANAIRQYIEQRGRSAIIDRNRRRSGQLCPMEKAQSDLCFRYPVHHEPFKCTGF